jgi:single-strand DNA-binding protein
MHDTLVTLQGNLGADVRYRDTAKGPVASFRVGTKPSWRDRETGQWVSGDTTWYSVSAWRDLADHCRDSLRRGDPVVVHGRLTAREWSSNGAQGLDLEVNAVFVGHDLNRGTTVFTRSDRAQPATATPEEVAAEAAA